MSIVYTVLAFVISLGILISFHEWGHFYVARKMGVKVLRFSIGFGKPLYLWRDKQGTEFAIALIPLGGYVKMLDEREQEVAHEEKHQAFNRKTVWQRMAIVIAGPVANFILAIIAIWIMYFIGIKTIAPTIGEVIPNSPAATAGMTANSRITRINNQTMHSWNDVNLLLARYIGEKTTLLVTTLTNNNEDNTYDVMIEHWPTDLGKSDLLTSLGISIWTPKVLPIIGKVFPNLPAEKAGLKAGDKIVSINNKPVEYWKDIAKIINKHPLSSLTMTVERNKAIQHLTIKPDEKLSATGKKTGFIGVEAKPIAWPKNQIVTLAYNPFYAFTTAVQETGKLISITTQSLLKMIIGILSLNNLGGPVTIAKVAGASLHSGISSFLYFIAMISVSLGIINLLPIPGLDGGHMLYYIIEAFRGRPISEKIQNIGLRIGIVIILCVMIFALYNDISHL